VALAEIDTERLQAFAGDADGEEQQCSRQQREELLRTRGASRSGRQRDGLGGKKDRYREQSAASGESAVYQPMWWMMLRRTSAAKTRAMAMAAASTLKASLLCGSDCLLFEMLRGI
jgi:hypothetical protein